jgi:hypothetical protein
MHITVFCPHCQSRYQVEPTLDGKRMRCPNPLCRMVFEAREAEQAAPPSVAPPDDLSSRARGPLVTGSVGDVIPVLASEAIVSQDDADLDVLGDEGELSPLPAVENGDPPLEMQPGMWEVPPVRAVTTPFLLPPSTSKPLILPPTPAVPMPSSSTSLPPGVAVKEATRPSDKRRRSLALVFVMLAILGGVLAVGTYLVSNQSAASETERFKKAVALYQDQDFEGSMAALQRLLRDYPTSKGRRQYDFLVELSSVREAVYAPRERPEDRAGALEQVLQFLEINKNDPLLKEYHGDVWHTLVRLSQELTRLAEEKENEDYLKRARRSWEEATKFTPPNSYSAPETAKKVTEEFTRVDKLLAARAARQNVLDKLRQLAARGDADAVRAGRALAKRSGMEHDAEVTPLLDELVKAHRARTVFVPAQLGPLDGKAGPDVARPRPAPTDGFPSFFIAPTVGKSYHVGRRTWPLLVPEPSRAELGPPARTSNVVLALARGVLYALDGDSGEVRWVRRVGVDTTMLPVHVPASAFQPELFLVLSSDGQSVTAVTADTGCMLWQQGLSGACVGQPVLVDRHLLVPTLTGQVDEIEISGGVLQGSYDLGQPLVVGGVWQPGTSLVYFPADSYSVYVLDVAERSCAAILYSGHAPGSLRGLPLILGRTAADNGRETAQASRISPVAPVTGRLFLLLNLASGAGSVEMHPYALPIQQPDQKPLDLHISVRGDSWAPPWHDAEKLALATDAGLLALYGIRQKGNRERLLFPLLQDDYRLEGKNRENNAAISSGRALVVYADVENHWVVSGGKLQRLQATFTARSGPGLAPRWPQPIDVGSPRHAGEVHIRADGRVALILVTQELDGPTCSVRAVDADSGQVFWRRQLGMVPRTQPAHAGDAVLVSDSTGMLLFRATQPSPDGSWQPAGTFVETPDKRIGHWMRPRSEGFVHLSWNESVLDVRLVDTKGGITVRTHPLPAQPLGTPALGSDFVLLPLANGNTLRVPLGEGEATSGPDWRGAGVDESRPGHIVALGNNDFAIADGGRSITRLHWGEANAWEKIGDAELPQRVLTAPAVLGNRVLVADASSAVTMLEGERLAPRRRWSVGADITTGPFVHAGGIGVIVGKNRLIWLDPNQEQSAWEYSFVAPIVGQPELVEGLLLVADLQGGITALDPATGTPVGSGYRLKANEAPASAPLAFGPGQLFVPLMDGTAMVIPMDKLR